MSKQGSTLLIEDDEDDQSLISQATRRVDIVNPIHVFHNGQDALRYLEGTPQQPLLIELTDQPPLDLLSTISGFGLVDDVLTRIEYGVYS